MDAKTFLDNFGTVAEAPGGVDRLRELILDLALAGRLLQADRDDEPVDALLGRLRSDRERTIREWGFREQKLGPPIASDEPPHGVPAHWAWVRLAEVAHPQAGFAFRSTGFNEVARGLPLVRIRDIGTGETECFFDGDYREEFVIVEGDYLVGMDGNFNIRRWSGARALLNQRVTRLVFFGDEVERQFVVWALQREINKLHGSRAYTTVQHLSGKQIAGATIPLPPVAEQQRIVAKVDELMQLCDDLEARQLARHHVTTRLRASSLDALTNAETDDDLHTAWSRIHTNWEALTDHPDSIDALRDGILMLAVRGLLTDRNPNEPPADRLVADLHDRRKALEREGAARRIPVAQLEPYEMPFEIPDGWCWTQAELLTQPGRPITYGILKPVWVETGVPTVRVTEMKTGRVDTSALPLCDPARAKKFEKSVLEPGDLLISKDGTIGKTAFVPPDLVGANITQHVLRFAVDRAVDRHFVRIVIDSPHGQSWMKGETKGVALQGINVGDFRRTPIPLPPRAEQERIARVVGCLMELCDGLELAIAQRENVARLAAASVCQASLRVGVA